MIKLHASSAQGNFNMSTRSTVSVRGERGPGEDDPGPQLNPNVQNEQQEQAPVPFFLTPSSAMVGTLDYTRSEARKYFTKATKKLDVEELYDCTPGNMYHFLKLLDQRANENGWDDEISGILWIPEDIDNQNSELRYLPTEYGRVTLEQITDFEKSYLGTERREAQDNYMLYKCLMSSLTKEARMKIEGWENEYMIRNNQGTRVPSGNLLLKVLIRESHLDTNATTQSIRMKLSNLDDYMLKINSDITKFNGYVKILVRSLEARGQKSEALLTHLFKGYLSASDKIFVRYINDKKDRYEEGKPLNSDKLMQLADNKYRLLKEREEWDAPSPEEEKIMALEAAVEQLKKKKSGHRTKKDKKEGSKTPSDLSKKRQFVNVPKPAWMHERPKEEDLHKPKNWNGKRWWYCHPDTGGKCDGEYRRHEPKDCQGKAFKGKRRKKTPRGDNKVDKPTPGKRELKVAEALSTIVDDHETESDSSADGYES